MSPIAVLSSPFQPSPLYLPTPQTTTTAPTVNPKKRTLLKRAADLVKGLTIKVFNALAAIFSLKTASWIGVGVTLFWANLLLSHLVPTVVADYGFNAVQCAAYGELVKISFAEVVVIAPLLEEVVFRGAMQPIVRNITYSVTKNKTLAQSVAIIATASLFGAVHFVNGTGMLQVILTTVLGVALGILRETEGLDATTLAHISNNFTAWSLIQSLG